MKMTRIGWFVTIFALLGGCVTAQHPNQNTVYYVLEYDAPRFADRPVLPVVIQVDRFQVAPFYHTQHMVYRDSPFTSDTDFYHKWRVNPGDLVAYYLARDIRESRLFRGTLTPENLSNATHILEGTVEEFYQHASTRLWEAVLSVSVVLLAAHEPDPGKSVLLQKTYTARKACEQRTPAAFAEAMSRAMAAVSTMMTTDIYTTLSADNRRAE